MAFKNVPRAVTKASVKRYSIFLMRRPEPVRQSQLQILSRWAYLKPIVEEVQRELTPPKPDAAVSPSQSDRVTGVQTVASIYPSVQCEQRDPLNCDACRPIGQTNDLESPQTSLPYEARGLECEACGFPALLPEQQTLGDRANTYRIDGYWKRRGTGRLYVATQLGSNQPVVVKEYLLPKSYYTSTEARQVKQAFKNVAGISLADGRVQDFRVLQPLSTIADDLQERCYLILDERNGLPSLNQLLLQGAMTPRNVRLVLNQVLQTLEFLHGQMFRFPSGIMQTGVPHGNINLDSLLIEIRNQTGKPASATWLEPEFFIYLCDLAPWEQLFNPAIAYTSPGSFIQDLTNLGYVAFYLLVGRVTTDANEPVDPRNPQFWQTVDPFLKQFILRLIGIEPAFESAEVARRELRQLPQLMAVSASAPVSTSEAPEPTAKFPRILLILLGVLGIGMLAWLLWLLWPKSSPGPAIAAPLCCLKDVGGIPPGKFSYTAVKNGTWSYVLQKSDLIQKGQTLEQRLQQEQPKLQLQFKESETLNEAIASVQQGKIAFAVVPLVFPLSDDLEATAIAYDGLTVFVPFSYSEREGGLPVRLRGQITLEQLQQLYIGDIFDWRELAKGSSLPVNVYLPENPEAVSVFEQRVFKSGQTFTAIAPFAQNPAKQVPEFAMMRRVLQDFEPPRREGSIGFSSISKVVGQCSVYPLAIQATNQPAVQPIVLNTGDAIAPTVNLCNRKGSYHPNVELFKTGRYPLAYPIAVIYPRANNSSIIGEKFAEVLQTREGQKLLNQTGLVPLE